MADLISWNHSTWLAHRAQEARDLGEPEPPEHVALPGALQAIPHDRLVAHQELGHSEQHIVGTVNERWLKDNHDRVRQHAKWVHGPYQQSIRAAAEAQAQAAAETLRRQALLEEILAERENH